MFRLNYKEAFRADSTTTDEDGRGKRLCGQKYVLEVVIEGDELLVQGPNRDTLISHCYLGTALRRFVESYLNRKYLNDSTGLDRPTLEVLSEWAYYHIEPIVTVSGMARLLNVGIHDDWGSCTYYPGTTTLANGTAKKQASSSGSQLVAKGKG